MSETVPFDYYAIVSLAIWYMSFPYYINHFNRLKCELYIITGTIVNNKYFLSFLISIF